MKDSPKKTISKLWRLRLSGELKNLFQSLSIIEIEELKTEEVYEGTGLIKIGISNQKIYIHVFIQEGKIFVLINCPKISLRIIQGFPDIEGRKKIIQKLEEASKKMIN